MSKLVVADVEENTRLDTYLASSLTELSRSSWKKLVESGAVLLNGQGAKGKHFVEEGDLIEYSLPKKQTNKIDVEVVYEDDDVLVIDKPAGLLVHSKGGLHTEQTVVDVFKDKLPNDGTNRPGIVHRLDRDTSGVMILAKNNETKTYLQKQFQNRTVLKEYVAVCEGVFKESAFLIDAAIRRSAKKPGTFVVDPNGKSAQTDVAVMSSNTKSSLVRMSPRTGRTHQLRVHLKYLGHPIVGDRLYGTEATRLYLHARKLSIAIRHNDHKTFISEIPKEFSL